MQLLLIDGHSLAYRSYFAYTKGKDGGLKTATGMPTSVCFGFIKALFETIDTYQPDGVAIAFDLPQPTFRHQADASYKGDRSEMPDDLIVDLANLMGLLQALNLPIVTAPGYEADDVLGTLATRGMAAGYGMKIVSGDKDIFQLVDDAGGTSVIYLASAYAKAGQPNSSEFKFADVVEKMGVTPAQIIDYKALCGDKSDSIPGVRGIGGKTAVKLLGEYQTLDGIYGAIDDIPGANGNKLREGKESAYHSQFLATIVRDVPLAVELDDIRLRGFDRQRVVGLFQELELNKFVKEIDRLARLCGQAVTADVPEDNGAIDLGEPDDDGDLWFFSAADTAAQTRTEIKIKPVIIDSIELLNELVTLLKQHQDPDYPVAWDTETTDLDPQQANLVGIGCCWSDHIERMAYIPVGHYEGNNIEINVVLSSLREILESTLYPKVLQNAKFDRLVFKNQGIILAGVVGDTMLASYVLDPDASHNLTDLSKRYLGIIPTDYRDLVPKGKTIADIKIDRVAEYCGMDVYTTYRIHGLLIEKLQAAPKLLDLYRSIELPLEPVLAAMEDRGIRINAAYLKELSVLLDGDLKEIETKTYELAGVEFNLGSPKQLSEVLFDRLGLDTKNIRKTKTGYSTDATTLEKLQGKHPVVDGILQYRTFAKLKSTYVDALPTLISPKTDRVHTDFNQAVTTTGRLSSSNPNLQNIPIRTEFSRQIRKAFIPAENWILAAADYSQIELRILAHLCQEPVLIEAYRSGRDIHTITAELLFETDKISSEQRRLGKIINFGVIYGMGAAKFAREMGVKTAEAKIFIDKFYHRYPGIFDYLERVKRQAIALGYVETICGRRRYINFEGGSLRRLKGLDPNDIDLQKLTNLGQLDAGLLRAAANAPIQGSSADIIKLASIELARLLQNYQAKILLQVHDELVLEMPTSEWDELSVKIKTVMEQAIELSVPLLVDIQQGENWMEAK